MSFDRAPTGGAKNNHKIKKVIEREQSEQTNFLEGLWLFAPLVKNEAHGQTVGQRIGEEVVDAWASRAPERASTERRGAPRDSKKQENGLRYVLIYGTRRRTQNPRL